MAVRSTKPKVVSRRRCQGEPWTEPESARENEGSLRRGDR
jgi:hypothetical protein